MKTANLLVLSLILMLAAVASGCQAHDSEPAADSKVATEAEASPATDADEAACEMRPPQQDRACTMDYRPVCGCDGKNYSNGCMAGVAGVPHHTEGSCEDQANGPRLD